MKKILFALLLIVIFISNIYATNVNEIKQWLVTNKYEYSYVWDNVCGSQKYLLLESGKKLYYMRFNLVDNKGIQTNKTLFVYDNDTPSEECIWMGGEPLPFEQVLTFSEKVNNYIAINGGTLIQVFNNSAIISDLVIRDSDNDGTYYTLKKYVLKENAEGNIYIAGIYEE